MIKMTDSRYNLFGRSSAFVILLFLSLASAAQAQTGAAAEATALHNVENRANRLIDTTMKIVAERVAAFNEQVSEINQVRPLELASLDSASVAANIPKIIAFTTYLANYKSTSDSLGRLLEDTLYALQSEIPPNTPDNSLAAFQKSYTADREAFDVYAEKLRGLYQNVLDVLLFMQHAHYHIVKNQLQISVKSEIDTYQSLMKKIDASSKELKVAMEESRKATAFANKKIEEINKKSQSGE